MISLPKEAISTLSTWVNPKSMTFTTTSCKEEWEDLLSSGMVDSFLSLTKKEVLPLSTCFKARISMISRIRAFKLLTKASWIWPYRQHKIKLYWVWQIKSVLLSILSRRGTKKYFHCARLLKSTHLESTQLIGILTKAWSWAVPKISTIPSNYGTLTTKSWFKTQTFTKTAS